MESLCCAKLSNVQTIQKDTRRKYLQDEIQRKGIVPICKIPSQFNLTE